MQDARAGGGQTPFGGATGGGSGGGSGGDIGGTPSGGSNGGGSLGGAPGGGLGSQASGVSKMLAPSAQSPRAALGLPRRHSGREGWAHHECVTLPLPAVQPLPVRQVLHVMTQPGIRVQVELVSPVHWTVPKDCGVPVDVWRLRHETLTWFPAAVYS